MWKHGGGHLYKSIIASHSHHVDEAANTRAVEHSERTTWLMVHPAHASTVSPCGSDFVALSEPNEHTRAAAIANTVLESGIFRLRFAVQGDAIVGVASADETDGKEPRAWGLSTATGCLTYASNASHDDLVGVEVGPQRAANDAVARVIEFEVNCHTSKMRLRCRGNDKDSLRLTWKDVPVNLPGRAVGRWALIPGRSHSTCSPRCASCRVYPYRSSAAVSTVPATRISLEYRSKKSNIILFLHYRCLLGARGVVVLVPAPSAERLSVVPSSSYLRGGLRPPAREPRGERCECRRAGRRAWPDHQRRRRLAREEFELADPAGSASAELE